MQTPWGHFYPLTFLSNLHTQRHPTKYTQQKRLLSNLYRTVFETLIGWYIISIQTFPTRKVSPTIVPKRNASSELSCQCYASLHSPSRQWSKVWSTTKSVSSSQNAGLFYFGFSFSRRFVTSHKQRVSLINIYFIELLLRNVTVTSSEYSMKLDTMSGC